MTTMLSLYIESDISPLRKTQKPRSRADWQGLKEHMRSFYAQFTTHSDSPVNDMWESFKKELYSAIDKDVPSKVTKATPKAPWITKDFFKL